VSVCGRKTWKTLGITSKFKSSGIRDPVPVQRREDLYLYAMRKTINSSKLCEGPS
jgi:hypothetical protein